VTNDFYHRKRENAHIGIRGREREVDRSGRGDQWWLVAGPRDMSRRRLWWPSSGEGDGHGGKRGGQETQSILCFEGSCNRAGEVRQGAVCDGEVEAATDLVVHGGRAVSGMKIRGRGERGRPVREGRPVVASGRSTGCITAALVVVIIGGR
jgi:hypothetical protein